MTVALDGISSKLVLLRESVKHRNMVIYVSIIQSLPEYKGEISNYSQDFI